MNTYTVTEVRAGAMEVHTRARRLDARQLAHQLSISPSNRYSRLDLARLEPDGSRLLLDSYPWGVVAPAAPAADRSDRELVTRRLAAAYLDEVLMLRRSGSTLAWSEAAQRHSERSRSCAVTAFAETVRVHRSLPQYPAQWSASWTPTSQEPARHRWLRDNEDRMITLAIEELMA